MKKIKSYIRSHNKLYVIARCIKNLNDPNLVKLLKGYYDDTRDCISIIIEHRGEKYPDKTIYDIQFLVPDEKKPFSRNHAGFCALLRWTLLSWSFPDALGMIPAVEWGKASVYYDSAMDSVTTNVFEYYFEPVCHIYHSEICKCRNVISAKGTNGSFFFMDRASDMLASYQVKQSEIEKLGYLYKKYVHLNQNTKEYIDESINHILDQKDILAVHVRGTDFNLGANHHPIVVTPQEYLAEAKKIYLRDGYKKVFLATDDANALKLFKEEFKDKLLYYEDTLRSGNHSGVHSSISDRPLHHYKLGLEILRDIYTIASCDSLVCGLSQVSIAAQYINVAIGRTFKKVVILNNGINEKAT